MQPPHTRQTRPYEGCCRETLDKVHPDPLVHRRRGQALAFASRLVGQYRLPMQPLGYRVGPKSRVSRLRIRTFGDTLARWVRRVLVVLGVVAMAPIVLHLALWSRVVDIACARTSSTGVRCVVEESTLLSQRRTVVDLERPERAILHEDRSDCWIAVESEAGSTRLTSDFNLAKTDQHTLAEELFSFFQDPSRLTVRGSFGSRWGGAMLFAGLYGVLFPPLIAIMHLVFGHRITITLDPERGRCTVDSQTWPFPKQTLIEPLTPPPLFAVTTTKGIELGILRDDGRRTRVVRRGEPLYPALIAARDQLNQWLRAKPQPDDP